MNTQPEFTHELSSRKRRIAAILIDQFIFTFLTLLILYYTVGSDFLFQSKPVIMINPFIILPLSLIFFAKDSINGTSPGKWIMGIMIRDEGNLDEAPSFANLFMRNIMLIIWPIELIFLAVSAEKKRLGDNIANSVVVKNPNAPMTFPRLITLFGIGFAFVAFGIWSMSSAKKDFQDNAIQFTVTVVENADAYQYAVQALKENQEILTETGGIEETTLVSSSILRPLDEPEQTQLFMKIQGKEKDLEVLVGLEKDSDGSWDLTILDK